MFSLNHLALIEKEIEKNILSERLRFKPIYLLIENIIAESYVSNRKSIILGGSLAITLLLGNERNKNDFMYELYLENAFQYANIMTNKIAEYFDENTDKSGINKLPFGIITLKTKITNQIYEIFYNNRLLVRLVQLDSPDRTKSENTSAFSALQPLSIQSDFIGMQLYIIPPELYLIEVYRSLYSPNECSNWDSLLTMEKSLNVYINDRFKDLEKIGASEENNRKQIEKLILKEYIQNNPNIVLIGDHAEYIITNIYLRSNKFHLSDVIEIISNEQFEVSFEQIKSLITKILPSANVFKTIRELHILKDFRLRRMTVKVDLDGETKDVMYIYNSAQYELIPFHTITTKNGETNVYDYAIDPALYVIGGSHISSSSPKKSEITTFIQVGTIFVILRFILINLWMIRWILILGKIDINFAKNRSQQILKKYLNLNKLIGELKKMDLFPMEDSQYCGFYTDENISTKIKGLHTSKPPDYLPQIYKSKHLSYR